ncbi:hypothetical protein [Rhodococcus opacus]|uniref:hypothetical protein n=1 Tax=Rhodococcus opacus TaxID=37919 RepID=UPI00155A6741
MAESDRVDGVGEIIRQWARTRPELDVSALEIFGRLHRSFLLFAELARMQGGLEGGQREQLADLLSVLEGSLKAAASENVAKSLGAASA